MDEFIWRTINYFLGLFVGWWIWGTKARKLQAAIERCRDECARALGINAEINKNLGHVRAQVEQALRNDGQEAP